MKTCDQLGKLAAPASWPTRLSITQAIRIAKSDLRQGWS
jgi:hypothetical protein